VSAKISVKCAGSSFGKLFVGSKKMRVLGLVASAAFLVLLAACSTNANVTGVGCPGNTGSFSNASLPANSQWAYELSGTQGNTNVASGVSPYREAGVITVDGNGHITSGTDDFYQQGLGGVSGYVGPTAITGTYSITPNGTGSMTVSFGAGSPLTWAITMQGNSFYIIEADTFASAHGVAHKQTGPFAAPTGTFAFRTHALGNASGTSAAVGEMTVSGGNISGGTVDFLNGGVLSTQTVGGSFLPPDTTGRGTASISYGNASTFTFAYLMIDSNTIQLFETDSNTAVGRMETQTGPGSFTDASFSGPYAFGSFGDSAANYGGTDTVGQLTTDGSGNLVSGSYDGAQDGNVFSVAGLGVNPGTYSVASNGRFTMTINGAGASAVTLIGYLVSPGRAFFLFDDITKTEDGTMDAQSSSSFAITDVSGQFAMLMGGNDATDFVDRTGVAQADGKGGLNLAYVLNRTGVISSPSCLTGTYTIAANGRVVGSVTSLSSNLVFYMVSPNQAYILQGDGGAQIYGGMAVQSQTVADPPGAF